MRLRLRMNRLAWPTTACRQGRKILRAYVVTNIAARIVTAIACCSIIRITRGRRSFAGGPCRRDSSGGRNGGGGRGGGECAAEKEQRNETSILLGGEIL